MPESPDLTHVLGLFAGRMAGGYALCLGLIGPSVTSGSWRKVSLFVIAGLTAVGLAAGLPVWPCAALGACALVLERAFAFGLRGASPLWIAPFGLWLLLRQEPLTAAVLPSAIALGGTLGAMLLGHSYLTARGLSFQPLQRMAVLLFAILLVRAGFVAPAFFADLRGFDWVLLAMRASLGLGLPIVLAWMVVQCVRIESNQSATGILYAMTVLVAVFGELIAIFLQESAGVIA